jgi:hypothetical protein
MLFGRLWEKASRSTYAFTWLLRITNTRILTRGNIYLACVDSFLHERSPPPPHQKIVEIRGKKRKEDFRVLAPESFRQKEQPPTEL